MPQDPTIKGDLNITAGASCTGTGVVVGHDLKIQHGGTLVVSGLEVDHDVNVEDGATLQVTGGHIGHDLKFKHPSGGPNIICGLTVDHDLTSKDDGPPKDDGKPPKDDDKPPKDDKKDRDVPTTFVIGNPPQCAGNTIGHDLRLEKNFGQITVIGNTVGHMFGCKGNVPAEDTGTGNIVDGVLQLGC